MIPRTSMGLPELLVVGLVLVLTVPAAHGQLTADSACTATILGRSATVDDDGSFLITSIPGEEGFHRVRVHCAPADGSLVQGQSSLFPLPPGDTQELGGIDFANFDPLPEAVQVRITPGTLTRKGELAEIAIEGVLEDGTVVDMSATAGGTEYWVSNPELASLVFFGGIDRTFLLARERGRVLVGARRDGLVAAVEVELRLANDADGDGMTDEFERILGLDPDDPEDALGDPDGDNLSNLQEFELGTDIFVEDTDGDGIPDGREVELGSLPTDPDSDGDGLEDGQEITLSTGLLSPDTDLDGFSDGDEVAMGTDPLVANTVATLLGQVVDDTDAVRAGATVVALDRLTASTDEAGRFAIDVPADGGALELVARALRSGRDPETGAARTQILEGRSAPIVPPAGQQTDVGVLRVVPMDGRLAGRVLDARDEAVAGVRLTLRSGTDVRAATSDFSGFFSFDELPAGELEVRAVDPATGLRGQLRDVMPMAGDLVRNIRLAASATIHGRVLEVGGETPAGAGVVVNVRAGGGDPLATVLTDREGRYRFDFLPLATYALDALDRETGDRARTEVVLEETSQVVEADLVHLGRGRVEVTVRGETGAAVGGAPVTVRSTDFFNQSFDLETDASGRVSVDGVFVGRVQVSARHPVGGSGAGAAGDLRLDGDVAAFDLILRETGNLAGRVLEADGVTPVAAAVVEIVGGRAVSAADGSYLLEDLRLGRYTARASKPASLDCATSLVELLAPLETVNQDLVMHGLATLRITVRWADGEPARGARVRANGGNPCRGDLSGETDASGLLVIPGFPQGTLQISALSPVGGLRASETVTVLSGETLDLTLDLEAAGSIAGTVYGPDGVTPARGVEVLWNNQRRLTSADGGYRFDFVPALRAQKIMAQTVQRNRLAQATGLVVPANDVVLRQDLVLSAVGVVSGTVTDSTGAPAPGAFVTAAHGNPAFRSPSTRADLDGRFRLEGVPEGDLRLRASRGAERGEASGLLLGEGSEITVDVQLVAQAKRPINLWDANNQKYPIRQESGGIQRGSLGIFDGDGGLNQGAQRLSIGSGGEIRPFGSDTVTRHDRGVVLRGADASGLEVTRDVLVPRNGYFARYLDRLHNPTADAIVVDVRWRTDLEFLTNVRGGAAFFDPLAVVATSSGDELLDGAGTEADRWLVLDAESMNANGPVFDALYPTYGLVWQGEGGARSADRMRYELDFAGRYSTLESEWLAVTVPPGETLTWLHFVIQQSSGEAATAAAARLDALPPEGLLGLTAEDVQSVVNFSLPAGGVSDLDPLPPLDGQVTGTVFEGDGVTPVRRAEVSYVSDEILFSRRLETQAGGDGRFVVAATSVNDGRRRVVPVAPFSLEAVHPSTRARSPRADGDFPAGASNAAQDLTFVDTGQVEGTVFRDDGQVASFGDVVLRAREELVTQRTSFGGDGSYGFVGLPPDVYSLVARAPHPQGSPLVTAGSAAVSAGGERTRADLTLPATGGVEGAVLNGDGSAAVALTLTLRGPSFTRVTATDTGGLYRLLDLPEGTYRVRVVEPVTGIATELPVDVVSNTVTRLDLPLLGFGSALVTATFPDGSPVVGGEVRVASEILGGAFEAMGETGEDGFLRAQGVPVGDLTVRVLHPNNRFLAGEVDAELLEGGGTVALAVTVPFDTAPAIEMILPAAGTVAQPGEVITLQAAASDAVGLDAVLFEVDGVVVASDRVPPFRVSYQVTGGRVPGSSLAITAVAVDNGGNRTRSAPVSVTVGGDASPPQVTLLEPTLTEAVEGTRVRLRATATDNQAIERVELFAGGELVAVRQAAEATLLVDVGAAGPGGSNASFSLEAVAYDFAGNEGRAGKTLIVLADQPPILEVLSAPASGTRVTEGDTLRFEASAQDDVDVDVELVVGGDTVQVRKSPPFRFDFVVPAAEILASPFEVLMRARDSSGQTVSSAPIELEIESDRPPQVSVLEPAAGSAITEGSLFMARASASDDLGVASVLFRLAGEDVVELTAPPFEAELRMPSGTEGELVRLEVVATDGSGLSASAEVDLSVRDDGVFPEITLTAPADGERVLTGPADIVLVLDRTSSNGRSTGLDFDGDGSHDNALEAQIHAARRLLARIDPVDHRVGLVTLASGPVLIEGLSNDFATLDQQLAGLSGTGGDGSFDSALTLAREQLASGAARRDSLPVIVLFTGGRSEGEIGEALGRLPGHGVIVHAVTVSDGDATLTDALAAATGGVSTRLVDPAALPAVLEQIGLQQLLLAADATDDVALQQVSFRVSDGTGLVQQVVIAEGPPYEAPVALPDLADATPLTITGRALDFGDNLTVTDAVTVVAEPTDISPAIFQLSPRGGLPGDRITVLGRYLSILPSFNAVTFSGVPATVVGASKLELEVIVPAGVGSGPVAVTVAGEPAGELTFVRDSDRDGLSDEEEAARGTNPNDPDSDGDGVSDGEEVLTHGTDPLDSDSDDDGLPDGFEIENELDPNDPQDATGDADQDGLDNLGELAAGTDPLDADSDDDGLSDGDEVLVYLSDPLDRDTDDGGVDDGTEVAVGTSPTDPTDDRLQLPVDLFDGEGFRWLVEASGLIRLGTNDAFDRSFYRIVNNVNSCAPPFFGACQPRAVAEDAGREVVFQPRQHSRDEDLFFWRKVFVPEDDGFVRFLDVFENQGTEPLAIDVPMTVDYGTDELTQVVTTSDGDSILELRDRSIVTDDQDVAGAPTVAWVWNGLTSRLLPAALSTTVPAGGDLTRVTFRFEVPPGERRILMHFAVQASSQGEAIARADGLTRLSGSALAALEPGEAEAVVNFYAFPDRDFDRLSDAEELARGTNPDLADSDGDGLLDGFEADFGFDPLLADDAAADLDGDGLSNGDEQAALSDPRLADSDGDGLTDGAEIVAGSEASLPDTDDDGLLDGEEVNMLGTDPTRVDTDGCGEGDGAEILSGHDPLDPDDDTFRVDIPRLLIDGDGFAWDVQQHGGIYRGTDDAFSGSRSPLIAGAFEQLVDGERVRSAQWETMTAEDCRRELRTGVFRFLQGAPPVNRSRKIFVPEDDGFIRYLEIFQALELSTFEVEIETRVGSGVDTQVIATSSGDLILDSADRFLVTDDLDGLESPAVALVYAGATGTVQPLGASTTAPGGGQVTFRYQLTLGAGERAILMHFGVQRGDRAGALAKAESLAVLGGSALDGLSEEEQADIVNFFAYPDRDGDRLADDEELVRGTNPDNPDTDGDGLLDGLEVELGLDPTDPDDGASDSDGDGLRDAEEQILGTDPGLFDTDRDGLSDGAEVAGTSDPLLFDTDAGGRGDGDEVLFHGTDPVDALDDLEVGFPGDLFDGAGFLWDLTSGGRVEEGTSGAFDFGVELRIGDRNFNRFAEVVAGPDGRPAVFGNAGATEHRSIHVSRDEAFSRWLEIFDNPGSEPLPLRVEILVDSGADGAARVIATSSGDDVADAADRWWVVDDDGDGVGTPAVAHIFAGSTGLVAPSSVSRVGDLWRVGFELEVPPRDRVTLMHFLVQATDRATAISRAGELETLSGGALADLLEVDQRTTLNFFAYPDRDADRLADDEELARGTDPDDPDSDDDGLLDGVEVENGLDPLNGSDAGQDADGDGLINRDEIARGTGVLDPDSDDDGLPDGEEIVRGVDPLDPDSDDDQLSDGDEVQVYGTDPGNPDTDGGGQSDGQEVLVDDTDPTDPDDDFAAVTVSNGSSADRARLAVDSAGRLHLVWAEDQFSGTDLYYSLLGADRRVLIDDTLLASSDREIVRPDLAVDSAGQVHVVWSDFTFESEAEIRHLLLDPLRDDLDGSAASLSEITRRDAQLLSPDDGDRDAQPRVAIGLADVAHVVWAGQDDRTLRYARLAPDGTVTVPSKQVAALDEENPYQTLPGLVVDDAGNVHVTFGDSVDFNTEVFYLLLDGTSGDALIGSTLVSLDDTLRSTLPTIGLDAQGQAVIVFQDERFGEEGRAFELAMVRVDPALDDQDGSAADPGVVLTVPQRDLTPEDFRRTGRPSLATSAFGDLHVFFLDEMSSSEEEGLPVLEIFDRDGTNLGARSELADPRTALAPDELNTPSVAIGGGVAYAVWTGEDGGDSKVMLGLVNLDTDGDGLLDPEENRRGTGVQDPDSDDDGLLDGFEVAAGFDPLTAGEAGGDPDGDGLDNLREQDLGTDPRAADTDGDGLTDGDEVQLHGSDPRRADSDDDGLSDGDELARGTGLTDPDSDDDGLLDGREVELGLNPLESADGLADDDGDGLDRAGEDVAGTDPTDPDSDDDGLSDGDEVLTHGTDPLAADSDGDRLLDAEELVRFGTDPLAADSDGDERRDWQEIVLDGTNPMDETSVARSLALSGPAADQATLAVDDAGVHVAWIEDGDGDEIPDLHYALVTDGEVRIAGTRLSEAIRVGEPDLVVDGAGLVHLVYEDRQLANTEVFHLAIDPSLDDLDGSPADPAAIEAVAAHLVSTDDGVASTDPAVAPGTGERLHLVWADASPGEVRYAQLSTDGAVAVAERAVFTGGLGGENITPALAVSAGVHIAFSDRVGVNPESEIFYLLLDETSGATRIAATQVSGDEGGSGAGLANLGVAADGLVSLSYETGFEGDEDYFVEVAIARLDPSLDDQDGSLADVSQVIVQGPQTLTPVGPGDTAVPALGVSAQGDLFFAYVDVFDFEEGLADVVVRLQTEDGTVLIPEERISGRGTGSDRSRERPDLVLTGLTAHVVWVDLGEEDGEVRLRTVNPDSDGDGLSNVEEWLLGTDLQDGGGGPEDL